MLLEIWDSLHTPNASLPTYCDLHILAREFVGRSTIELFPSSGLHKHSTHFPSEFEWLEVFFG
jgi:hypothetical protein